MPNSPFFARIREHVLQLTASIPKGRICTYQSIGKYLDVMPRHVAYILSQLEDNEKFAYPWHRVVGADSSLGTPKMNPNGTSQADLLREEGIIISNNSVALGFEQVFIAAEQLPSGLSRQRRPVNAPNATQTRPRKARTR